MANNRKKGRTKDDYISGDVQLDQNEGNQENLELYYSELRQFQLRRSSRTPKRPEVFKIVHEERRDKDIRAAIKRSKLENYQTNIDYSSIEEIPTIFATNEEFENPVTFWNKYAKLGETYGAVKVIPPKEWKTMCPLDVERLKFKVREQQLKNLCNGKGFSHPTYQWDCQRMKEADREFVKDLFGDENPSVEDVERKYWELVKSGDTPLVVKYGADLNVYSPEFKEFLVDQTGTDYAKDPWNLKNLPKTPGSLLRYLDTVIPGVNSPWLYIGMCLASFCWHTEDNYFGAVNYHHWGLPKIWYIASPGNASKVENVLKNYLASESEEFAVYSLKVQVPPDVLISNGIPVYRIVQRENEFVFAWPRAFHSGLNVGFNCNEACNLAPVSWLQMGLKSVTSYRFNRKTCLSFFSLLMRSVCCYKDFSSNDLSEVIKLFSFMVSQEYNVRKNASYPSIQMYIHDDTDGCLDLGPLFTDASGSDFDPTLFLRLMALVYSRKEKDFLEGCKLLCSIPMKDCDLCDTPTFGSCLVCSHCNCTVCVTCSSYHPCNCDTRVVLYRYPLEVLTRLMNIMKRFYYKLTGQAWKMKLDWTIPSNVDVMAIDNLSVFKGDELLNLNHFGTPTLQYREHLLSTVTEKEKGTGQLLQNLESISTAADSFRQESSSSEMLLLGDAWDPNWFNDIKEAVSRSRETETKRENQENLSIYGEIAFNEPFRIHSEKQTPNTDNRSLAVVSKFTARYVLLALEEDRNESV